LDFMRDLVDAVDPVLGGALVDESTSPWVPGLERPSDLASLAARLVEVLGPSPAGRVSAGTVIATLTEHMGGAAAR
jgi:hypothetical protein